VAQLDPQPVTLVNTGLPLLILGAAALIVPRLLLPRDSRSQRRLVVMLLASVPLMVVAGVLVFGGAMAAGGADVLGAFGTAPGTTMLALARASAMGVLVWGPVLLLTGLALGTRIERMKGEDMARRRE
jgi:hypothetical protein